MLQDRLANNTGESILVNGPGRDGQPTDNSHYLLPIGQRTPIAGTATASMFPLIGLPTNWFSLIAMDRLQ